MCRPGRWRWAPAAYLIAQLLGHTRPAQEDALDSRDVLNWPNKTPSDSIAKPTRPLKVATRVRIPLGLLHGLYPRARASLIRVGS